MADLEAFNRVAADFLRIIIARERPVMVSDAERLVLDFITTDYIDFLRQEYADEID